MSDLFFCGELIADMAERSIGSGQFGLLPGGCSYFGAVSAASNVQLSHADHRVHYLGPVSRDDFGRRLKTLLLEKGVALDFAVETERPTTLAVIGKLPDGENAFQFYSEGTTVGGIRPEEMSYTPSGDGQSVFVYGSISTIISGARDVLLSHASHASQDGLVYFDLNARPVAIKKLDDYPALVDRWAAIADVVKASDVDLANAYPGQSRETIARRWIQNGAKLAIVTSGDNGSWAMDANGNEQEVAARRLVTPNTVGAGDSFNAGVCLHLASAVTLDEFRNLKWPRAFMQMALAAGNQSASLHLTNLGARPIDLPNPDTAPGIDADSDRDTGSLKRIDPQP